jgi:heme/copper-type cytochrome/quinol oxidase subunit 4
VNIGMATLRSLLRQSFTAVWAVLIAATLVSWYFGIGHGVSSHVASTLVIVVAIAKIDLVGHYFMGLRRAPARLRWGFDNYCLALCGALLYIYYFV